MPKTKNNESTSPRVAKIASELLRNPNTPAKVRTVAASVLTQTPNKTKPSGGKKR
jgi:hypothetical protein